MLTEPKQEAVLTEPINESEVIGGLVIEEELTEKKKKKKNELIEE